MIQTRTNWLRKFKKKKPLQSCTKHMSVEFCMQQNLFPLRTSWTYASCKPEARQLQPGQCWNAAKGPAICLSVTVQAQDDIKLAAQTTSHTKVIKTSMFFSQLPSHLFFWCTVQYHKKWPLSSLPSVFGWPGDRMHQQLVFTINLKKYYSVVLIYGLGFPYLYLELKQTLNIVS